MVGIQTAEIPEAAFSAAPRTRRGLSEKFLQELFRISRGFTFYQQAVARHLGRLRQAHHVEHGGSQIRQNAAVRQLALVADHNKRHRGWWSER